MSNTDALVDARMALNCMDLTSLGFNADNNPEFLRLMEPFSFNIDNGIQDYP